MTESRESAMFVCLVVVDGIEVLEFGGRGREEVVVLVCL